MTSPRDPRRRRQAPALHAAALRLEAAADDMRIDTRRGGPDTAAQLGTLHPPMTAAEFAAALGPLPEEEPPPVAEFPEPAPVAPMPPEPPASAPAFSSERSADGWVSRHDPRSRGYGVRAALHGSAPVADRLWPGGPVLDQGADGACIGFAVAAAANALGHADPMAVNFGGPLDEEDAARIYKRAQQLDEVPGESYVGTSVLAGMKAAVEAGLFGGYRWAFGTRDLAQAVLQVGPAVVGIPWSPGMEDTGPDGLLQVGGEPGGLGHALAVVGIVRKGPHGQPGPFFVLQNSRGPAWGARGLCYVHHRDLARLLRGIGEAAIPTVDAP